MIIILKFNYIKILSNNLKVMGVLLLNENK